MCVFGGHYSAYCSDQNKIFGESLGEEKNSIDDLGEIVNELDLEVWNLMYTKSDKCM